MMDRDPQAPAGLHRRRGADRGRRSRSPSTSSRSSGCGFRCSRRSRSSSRPSSTTAQAVVPGQGQSIRVAGVKVGDVADVELENGKGVVTFEIDRKYLPIYKDATILMRPTTASRTCSSSSIRARSRPASTTEGDTIPASNTAPDVNLDEILAALDGDSAGVPEAAAGRRRQGPRRPRQGPRQAARRPRADQQRPRAAQPDGRRSGAQNLANLIHNLNVLTDPGRRSPTTT